MSNERKYRHQTYRTAWESLPDFKGWLQPVPGKPTRAFCSACNKTLLAHRITLLQHTTTIKHTKRVQQQFLEERDENMYSLDQVEMEAVVVDVDVPDTMTLDNLIGSTPDLCSSDIDVPDLFLNPVSSPPQPDISNAISFQENEELAPVSTHVLDTSRGLPAQNMQVSLYSFSDGKWVHINDCVTNPTGRSSEFISREDFKPGRFKLHFDIQRYFDLRKQDSLYPFIEIVFDVHSPLLNYHIPLVLSPFGYSTYRGS